MVNIIKQMVKIKFATTGLHLNGSQHDICNYVFYLLIKLVIEGGHISWARASEERLRFSSDFRQNVYLGGFSPHASQTSVVIFTKSHNENPSSESNSCEAQSSEEPTLEI